MDRKQTSITTKEQSLNARWRSSTLADGNAAYLEGLYEQFLRDPASLPSAWRNYFESLPRVDGVERDVSHSEIREEFRRLAHQSHPAATPRKDSHAAPVESAHTQVKVLQLITAFRYRAHQTARLDPLGLREVPGLPELDLRYYGLTDTDLDAVFETRSLGGPPPAALRA